MKVHELNTRPLDVVPDFALSALRRWAREKPLQIALRHRRQGTWKAWRWIDVLREVERCAAGLRQQGFVPEARLVLCGAIEPSLLILAIAAHSLGGYSAVISPQSRGEVLQRQLRLLRPDFAFVQRRETVAHWRLAGLDSLAPLRLFCAQASTAPQGAFQVLPLATLFSGEPLDHARQGWAQAVRDEVVWVDEGTEWAQGLAHVLSRWLERGEGFAFPETRETASRDRREIAPTALLLSAQRAQTLAEEIEARLAPQGSWRRRLCDWTLADPRRGLRRWIKSRVRHLLGFQRVAHIEHPANAERASGRLLWLHEDLERVA
ncbi:AMP-binding protein [Pseudomonas defluvii]|nr:AMP-binding protein [Pseudomonas defluvii]